MPQIASIIALFIFFQINLFGQTEQIQIPYSYHYNLKPVNDVVSMAAISLNALKAEDAQNIIYGIKRKRFAKGFDTDFNPFNSGQWLSVANGGRVWRLRIRSANAYSIYPVFGKFHFENGTSLFIYNNNYSEIIGPLTSIKNNKNNILPVAPISGEEITIELNIPPGIEYFGELTLTKIWHDYMNEFGKSRQKSEKYSISGACNIDINCPLGAAWQTDKHAVCRLVVNGEYCTGTMVNNVRGEKIPYLLTAFHCVQNNDIAASAIILFNYENRFCSINDKIEFQSLEGGTLLATTPNQLDFSLLRLNRFPPMAYRAYLAGWESDPENPSNYTIVEATCIHHPSGDVKKISYDKDTLTTANFGQGFMTNSHWKVNTWESGVTEGGSSGASIFNNSHRIVGTLTGGDSGCGVPLNDYFSKFLLAWDYYPEKNKQLKAWLDPDNTGVTWLNGTDPYGFSDLNCDTISNIKTTETVVIEKNSFIDGYISGHNSQTWQYFAEKFHSTDTTQIAEILFHVAKVKSGGALSNIFLKVWIGENAPEIEIFSKLLYIKNFAPSAINYLRLDTALQLKGTFYIGYSINYPTTADTFALYYAPKQFDSTSTMYIRETMSWYNIKDISGINYPASLDIGYVGCKNLDLKLKTTSILKNPFKLYPNPCSTNLIAEFPETHYKLNLRCYAITGEIQAISFVQKNGEVNIDIKNLKPGIYWLTILANNKKYSGKFVVIR